MIIDVARLHVVDVIAATRKHLVLISHVAMAKLRPTRTVVEHSIVKSTTVARMRPFVLISHVAKTWSRYLQVDVERCNAWRRSAARKKAHVLGFSAGQDSTKACLTITAVTRSHVLNEIAATMRHIVMTTLALMEWFLVVTSVVVELALAQISSVVCQRHPASTITVHMACSSSQVLGLVVQPSA
jgi:hypothetical protein